MLYDNMMVMFLLDTPYRTIVTFILEDKFDKFVGHDDAIIRESPILFLTFANCSIEEKYSLAENICVISNYL
jgi:hypothetical protein